MSYDLKKYFKILAKYYRTYIIAIIVSIVVLLLVASFSKDNALVNVILGIGASLIASLMVILYEDILVGRQTMKNIVSDTRTYLVHIKFLLETKEDLSKYTELLLRERFTIMRTNGKVLDEDSYSKLALKLGDLSAAIKKGNVGDIRTQVESVERYINTLNRI